MKPMFKRVTSLDASVPATTLIPACLQGLTSVAAVLVSRDGVLKDANLGFFRLLPGELPASALLDIRSMFVNPSFADFADFAGRRSDRRGGTIFEGIFNVGDPRAEVASLHGTLSECGSDLLMIAEHDMAGLRKLNVRLLELNEDLVVGERGLVRSVQGLPQAGQAEVDGRRTRGARVETGEGAAASDAARPSTGGTDPPAGLRRPAPLEWTAELSIGIVGIDEEHKDLFGLFNAVEASLERRDLRDFRRRYKALTESVRRHFGHEEQVMRNIGFPDLRRHRAEHAKLLQDAEDFGYSISRHFGAEECAAVARYLRHWLLGHMIQMDSRIRDFLNRDG